MDKKVIFAVAGAGKTSFLIAKLDLQRRFLIVTYTNANQSNIERKIIQKFGYFPNNIKLLPYFTFLHSFCYRPLLLDRVKTRGINYNTPPLYLKSTDKAYYVSNNRIYSNRIAKIIEVCGASSELVERIEKYFDCLFIDEIQDIAGNDFNLLKQIVRAKVELLFVGDFYQHTFDTSRDGKTNAALFDDYAEYKKKFETMGLEVDTLTLNKSHRCSKAVCSFIKKNLQIDIDSHQDVETAINVIDNPEVAKKIFNDNRIVKLFYSEHYKHDCYSSNWGGCKGEDSFDTVCVVLNKTTQALFDQGKLHNMKPQTKNKFYVACSRARQDLFFMPDEFIGNIN